MIDNPLTPHTRAYAWATWCECPVCTFYRIDQRERERRHEPRDAPDRRQQERPPDGTNL
jgi:hypothetical protein